MHQEQSIRYATLNFITHLLLLWFGTIILQLHGAAYGKGIYLSPLSSVSFGYMGYNTHHGKPKVSYNIVCIWQYRNKVDSLASQKTGRVPGWQNEFELSCTLWRYVDFLCISLILIVITCMLCYSVLVVTKDLKQSGDIWVCPNSDHVCTRFFFVYDNENRQGQASNSIDTRVAKFRAEIDHAVAHIRSFKKPLKKRK